jgi:hypothetical protein
VGAASAAIGFPELPKKKIAAKAAPTGAVIDL